MPYVRIFLVSTSLEAPRSSSLEQSSLSLLSAFLPSHFSLKKNSYYRMSEFSLLGLGSQLLLVMVSFLLQISKGFRCPQHLVVQCDLEDHFQVKT